MAIAAYCSAVGPLGDRGVGDQHRVVRPTMTLIPNGVASGSSSITVRTCFSDWLNGRVVPVIIASAFAQREHRRGEVIAVLVDHPLDLAAQQPVALVLVVDVFDRPPDQRRIAAVEDLIVLGFSTPCSLSRS